MMELTIYLEATAPDKNIYRAYQIAAGPDIFGDWIVELTYGRIGKKGRRKVRVLAGEFETQQYVRQCLKRRESAVKRLGTGYQVKAANAGGLAWMQAENISLN